MNGIERIQRYLHYHLTKDDFSERREYLLGVGAGGIEGEVPDDDLNPPDLLIAIGDIAVLLAERDQLVEQRDTALALHVPFNIAGVKFCTECSNNHRDENEAWYRMWPCPTVHALGRETES